MRSELGKLTLDKVFRVRLKIVFQSEFVFIYLITLLFYIFLSSGKRDPKYQHSPLHKPGIRWLGNPLPSLWNQGYTCSTSGQRVHADAGERGWPCCQQTERQVLNLQTISEHDLIYRLVIHCTLLRLSLSVLYVYTLSDCLPLCRWRQSVRREPLCWSLKVTRKQPLTLLRVASKLRSWPRKDRKQNRSTKQLVG